MRVLLLSGNHTVQEMVSLALKDMKEVELVMAQSADQLEPMNYDLIMIDDILPKYQESMALIQALGIDTIVLLAQAGNMEAGEFGRVLRKPFLPSEVRELVGERNKELERDPDSSVKAKAMKKKKKKKNRKNTSKDEMHTEVLDPDEIEIIKALLEEEGLEIVNEEMLAEQVMEGDKGAVDRHDALLEALRTMRPRKIRKLLKGATVKIEITFPESSK